MSGAQEAQVTFQAEVRRLAQETYRKVCLSNPGMPAPDTVEGRDRASRLYDIIWKNMETT